MSMVDMKVITSAVKALLVANFSDCTIVRNARRNVDPNTAAQGDGWMGVYKGGVEYTPLTTGRYFQSDIEVVVEIQKADFQNLGAKVEDELEVLVQSALEVFTAEPTLSGTVDSTMGYDVDYDINTDNEVYIYSALITISAQVKSS